MSGFGDTYQAYFWNISRNKRDTMRRCCDSETCRLSVCSSLVIVQSQRRRFSMTIMIRGFVSGSSDPNNSVSKQTFAINLFQKKNALY